MKQYLLGGIGAALLIGSNGSPAVAQTDKFPTNGIATWCYSAGAWAGCPPSSGSGGTAVTATAASTPPATAPGAGAPLVVNLFGALYEQPTFAGTPVTSTVGLPSNIVQIGGVSYALGSAASASSAPVVIASDQLAIAIKGATSNASSGVATSSTNVSGVAYNYGFNGTTWDQLQVDGSKNLKVAGNTNSSSSATGSAVPANASYMGANLSGNLVGVTATANGLKVDGSAVTQPVSGALSQANADPCTSLAHTYTPISITTSTQIITGTSAKKIYICHLFLIAGAADNVGIVEGTGSVCASSTVGVIGGATAATGPNLSANAGFESGTGTNAIAATATNADNLCLLVSAASQLSGVIVTVQQ